MYTFTNPISCKNFGSVTLQLIDNDTSALCNVVFKEGYANNIRIDVDIIQTQGTSHLYGMRTECVKWDELIKNGELDTFYLKMILSLVFMNVQNQFDCTFKCSMYEGTEWLEDLCKRLMDFYHNR